MGELGGSEVQIVRGDSTDLGKPKEGSNIDEIQRQIVETVLGRLQDPRAVDLVYPNEDSFQIHHNQADPDYGHGNRRRFVVLDQSPFLGTDQLCVTATDNSRSGHTISQGARIAQWGQGVQSGREIAITRFVQTRGEKWRNGNNGTYYFLVLSENVRSPIGTGSSKGRVDPNRKYPPFAGKEGVPPFAEYWRDGNGQLASMFMYDNIGSSEPLTEADYLDMLKALQSAKVNPQMTQIVAENESKMRMAKGGNLKLPQ